ncbi:hypothetical protein SAMN05518672_105411 [Chitinophaga sp. CF118]|nr:hypothetical protein SAMN05518672_105411 [Chitinophaga sp. CF118]
MLNFRDYSLRVTRIGSGTLTNIERRFNVKFFERLETTAY